MRRTTTALLALLLAALLTGCGSDDAETTAPDLTDTADTATGDSADDQQYPDIEAAELTSEGDDTFTLAVTVSSPYDSPERYADGWRVLTEDGTVLGEMTLGHDHASEQPFTRTQSGLEIPEGVDVIIVEGRDTDHGYGGGTLSVDVG